MKKLLLGLLGGLSLGMLFAPKKGEELRGELSKSENKFQIFADNFSILAKTASDEVKEYLATKEAQDLITKGKNITAELVEKAKDLSENAQEELHALLKNAEEKGEKIISQGKKAAKKASDSIKS